VRADTPVRPRTPRDHLQAAIPQRITESIPPLARPGGRPGQGRRSSHRATLPAPPRAQRYAEKITRASGDLERSDTVAAAGRIPTTPMPGVVSIDANRQQVHLTGRG
jgi:hypothetical protein